jgi:uncharacterized membrane protein YhaH (DUF805 family)
MTSEVQTNSTSSGARRLGFWSAALMAVCALISFAMAVTTLPISGPFCQTGCVTYPYANVVSFVPHDYLWMYPGILLTPLFVVLMACIHDYARDDKKVFSQIGLAFALISAIAITMDYFIQLTVMQPSLLRGETEGLALFSQYNPHGIFIALEDLGYLLMSAAFLFAAPVFASGKRLERSIYWLFMAGSLAAIVAFIVLSLIYGQNLEYRFEVTVITINWITLIVAGVLLSILFKRAERSVKS